MSKRSATDQQQWLLTPGLKQAPVLDLMCSHFVLTLAARQGAKFNVRRDLNSLLSLSGQHLVWPLLAVQRLREFLGRRCKDNEFWRGHEALTDAESLVRHGTWRGPYEEGTLFFYRDEYAKDQPKDLLSVLAATGDWLTHALKKQPTLVEKTLMRWPTCCSSTVQNARCCCMERWPATSVICARCWSNSRSTTRPRRMPRWPTLPVSKHPRWPRPCALVHVWSALAWSKT